jgi:hypothetical protein
MALLIALDPCLRGGDEIRLHTFANLCKVVLGRAIGLSWRSLPALPWYVTGQARTQEDYGSFPGAVVGQPTPAPRESSPGIRASLLTQAKFF